VRRALAIGALLAAAAGSASAQDFAAAEASEVRFVDAAPAGPSVEERLEEIRRRIEAAVEYPPLARTERLEGEALVRFDIDAEGTPREVVLHRSSGRPSLDRAATRAVAAAAPLPWVYGRLEVPVRFSLDTRR
jgi:TonB family protein